MAKHKFSDGRAQLVALDESAEREEIDERLSALDYFANAGYLIRKARFLEAVIEEEAS